MASKIYTAQEMRNRAEMLDMAFDGHGDAAMLRQAAEMRERAEKRINELGKCSLYEEKNGGACPAWRGEKVTLYNCLDESCSRGAIIEELRGLLRGDAGKESK